MSNRKRLADNAAGLSYVIDDIQKEASHLTVWQQQAAMLILNHMAGGAAGSSQGLVGQINTKVDCSTQPRSGPPPGGYVDDYVSRYLRSLRKHEIDLISRVAFGRGRCLEEFGRINSGYKSNKTARAFAIGRVTALLESVAELAQLKPELPSVPT